jgi:selenocysteine lyase/cysteine desulfurase
VLLVFHTTKYTWNGSKTSKTFWRILLDDDWLLGKMEIFVILLIVLACFGQTPPPFGSMFREREFSLAANETYLNHGSYGAVPRRVGEYQMNILRQAELNSQKYMSSVRGMVDDTLKDLATYFHANREDIVLVEGSTTGANAVLRSIRWKKGDVIMYLNVEYGMIKRAVEFIVDTHEGIKVLECNITIPTNGSQILAMVQNCFSKQKVTLAIFDHVSSFPTMILPIAKLIQMARSHGAIVMVDGAHALGQVPVNLTALDPDFYFSSAHKWLCSTKGSAFLYVKKIHQHYMHPTVISHWYKQGFQTEFRFIGSRDYSSFLALKEAIKYRSWITDAAVYRYNNDLCERVGQYATSRWKSHFTVPIEMRASLIDVNIPCNVPLPACYSWTVANANVVLSKKGYTAFLGVWEHKRYWRISCQIYNEFSDYVKLIDELEKLWIVGKIQDSTKIF